MTEEERDKLDDELDEFSKSLPYESEGLCITQTIELLTKVKEKYGDIKIWYASGQDWALSISCAGVMANEPWEDTPEEITLYLS